MPRLFTRLIILCTLASLSPAARPAEPAAVYRAGVAKVDITPAHPIRLNGFGFRRTESEGVYQKIWAKALAIDCGDGAPAVLLTVDVLGIPADVYDALARRLAKVGVRPERLAITATHTHTGPMLAGANQTLFGMPIPPEHLANLDRYRATFLDGLEAAARAALKDLRSARLSWGIGKATFAINRRTKGGPVDHDLPVLFVKDERGAVRAVYLTYACHAVTLSLNKLGGDWPGYAQEAIEDSFPGAIALISIGCGADQNPSSGVTKDKMEVAAAQGREVAAEVKRLAGQFLAPLTGKLVAKTEMLELPLAELPTRAQWEEKAKREGAIGYHARVNLARLDRGEKLAAIVSYRVQTWAFGEALAMVFLPGEVVVDYARRLKTELDAGRLWPTAYANAAPCYIPSERVLKEGGYEGGAAMIYYDQPVPFRPGLEDKILRAVTGQLGKDFAARSDPARTGGSRPLSPQQSLAALRVRPGLRVDLMAAEPLVADPVALAFDADGKLWIAEMADYPSGRTGKFEPGGRVACLEDTDGDGRPDTRSVFLDGLSFPTGVLPWRKGVLVCAAPDILYAEDTDGDGKADVVTKLYSGFGTENYQARVNSLQYGLDGWVYGSCGLFGGTILCHRTGKKVDLGHRDFRIKPDTGELEPATGRTQQGRVRDDEGNWFGCDNSNLVRHYPLADHYLRRNPHAAAALTVVAVPAATQLFPLKADAQRFKLSGPPGGVTAACGLGIYRDDWLGAEFTGNTFTCEPVNLLVHRLRLTRKQGTFVGTRDKDEAASEFLASSDNWFRPVHAVTGPDGGLWIADMYRFLIEHPRWIPAEDLAKIDPRAGSGLGRIYRVLPAGKSPRPWPRLDRLDTTGLVAALDSPSGWQRDLATQQLLWRNDATAREPLERLASASPRALARLHALVALDGLGGLRAAVVAAALGDTDSVVRRHAIRLAEPWLARDATVAQGVLERAGESDAQVLLQLAYTLGTWRDARAAGALAKLVRNHAADPLLSAAVASSLNEANLQAVAFGILPPVALAEPPAALLRDVLATAAACESDVVTPILARITGAGEGKFRAWQLTAAAGALDALERQGRTWPRLGADMRNHLAPLVVFARKIADSADIDEAALALLGRDPEVRAVDVRLLSRLLAATRPAPVQATAIAVLARIGSPDVPAVLIAAWPGATPELRAKLLDALLARRAWYPAFFDAAKEGRIAPGQIDAGRRQRLLTHADGAVRRLAEQVFAGAVSPDRAKVIATYESVLTQPGDRGRGKTIFARACAACHLLDGVGAAVGPDLAPLTSKSPRYLLGEILDPNRNLDARYLEYQAETRDGRVLVGVLAAETTTSITLRGQQGKEETILRADLDQLRGTARSLMPEGLEKELPPRDMADLLAYLAASGPQIQPRKE